uniref:Alanine--tRNA ligase n=1 Tax=Odontella aurita TaxID=265563 RepID=A0A7S4MEB0_9STRA|mmetsp:Transcript_19003/g.55162  ORF Transcript_19003/g.55162 Transcript_19003/m.55162 type:complete len:900 (+) Transcript_19003:500-3199(+)
MSRGSDASGPRARCSRPRLGARSKLACRRFFARSLAENRSFSPDRSFGDYFKEGAIDMAWQCLTEEFKLDTSRLYATYFAGDSQTPVDDEARKIWLKYLPPERVIPCGAEDNFWEMGAVGPCGPCTEIHYDRIGGRDAAALVNADLPDVIEIWNNVFIQYNREADGSLRPLPAQHVDTGMGFERLTSILQGKDSNYDTDIFMPLFAAIQKLTGAPAYSGKVGAEDEGFRDMAYRVVADHIRTLSFAIADGATPSNDGRGYVLRRVLRRAVRYGRQNLGAELGFFSTLVPTLVDLMGGTFPELKKHQAHVTAVIKDEEESFSKTLDKGLLRFKELADRVGDDKVFPGADAHFLYTSMGFPVDLTELMAEELGLTLDREGFDAKMKDEQDKSAEAHRLKMMGKGGKDMRLVAEQTAYLVNKGVDATDDEAKYVWNKDLEGCKAAALFVGRGETEDGIGFADSITGENGAVGLILDKTSFYAEAGGQTYDTGVIKTAGGAVVRIDNVQSYGQFVLHVGQVTEGTVALGEELICSVDYVRRTPIASNHTMTHVLNYALRDVLVTKGDNKTGQDVDQKGSLVDELKLRFDFSWNGPLKPAQLAAVEDMINSRISAGVPIQSFVAPLEDAKQISSLRAVFGEVYPDPVRVVSVSPEPIPEILQNPQDGQWLQYSVEFCGGTHLSNTKEAEMFVLLKEEGIAKGVRRITAVTGGDAKAAGERADEFEGRLKEAGALPGAELEAGVKKLSEELKDLSISVARKDGFKTELGKLTKKAMAWKKEQAAARTKEVVEQLVSAANEAGGNKIALRIDFGIDGKVAKSVAQSFAKKVKDKAFLLITADESSGRFMVVASAPKGMKDPVDCKAWCQAATEGTGAKGGGKKDLAQFNATGIEKIEGVLEKARSV